MSTNTNDLIAAFLANGGKVTKAAEGEGMGLTDRQWYRKGTDAGLVSTQRSDNDLIEQRRVVRDHMDREIVVNGLGERIS